jgi:fatty acid desaturase
LISWRLGLFLGGIAIPFSPRGALMGFVQVAPSFGLTLQAVAHRHGHQQHHEYDRDRDNDHDHARADREHGDKGGTQIPVSFLDDGNSP